MDDYLASKTDPDSKRMSHSTGTMKVSPRCGNSRGRARILVRGTEMAKDICSTDGCARPVDCRSLCKLHYQRLYKAGQLPIIGRNVPPIERFWPKVDKSGECWLWTAGLSNLGYGVFYPTKLQHTMAHRFAYELLVGPIPDGLELDHVCHTLDLSCAGGATCPHRRCVNPAHLEPVTHAENVRRGRPTGMKPVSKTHCARGHAMTPENTYVNPRGLRRCRTCRAAYRQKYNTKPERPSAAHVPSDSQE